MKSIRHYRFLSLILVFAMSITLISGCSNVNENSADDAYCREVFSERIAALKEAVLSDDLKLPEDKKTVFLSLCNREERASVVHATASDLEETWQLAEEKALSLIKENHLAPLWVKADVVTESESFSISEVQTGLAQTKNSAFRLGIALDGNMETAFLEAECNANGLYDYDNDTISQEAISAYVGEEVKLPSEITLFTTQGYFCGTDNEVRKLSDQDADFGIRRLEMNSDTAAAIVALGASYLQRQQLSDGSFRYGYHAASGEELSGYNTLRHLGAIWSLINAYSMEPTEELAVVIDKAINHTIENSVVYNDDGAAFIQDVSTGNLNLGGGSLAVIALTTYKEVFESNRHDELLSALGQGILAMSDPETGKYQHSWFGDFTLKEDFVSVYYEGEATFALCKLYGQDPNMAYLNMARKAVDRFIDEDYTKYRDHWVAYSVNELTKYDQSERYYAFALENVQNNLNKVMDADESYHTTTELLMAGYDTYSRIIENGASVKYLEQFDAEAFLNAIDYRINLGLASFGFPETIMYFANPMEMYGCFFIRRDNFRARIDDTQHFICGYGNYAKAEIPAES